MPRRVRRYGEQYASTAAGTILISYSAVSLDIDFRYRARLYLQRTWLVPKREFADAKSGARHGKGEYSVYRDRCGCRHSLLYGLARLSARHASGAGLRDAV